MQIEIFSTGTFRGTAGQDIEFTNADLDSIVENFHRLGALVKPPLKLGHAEKQVLAQPDGQMALGWVSGLKRVANKLVATITGMPAIVRDLIQAGRFRRVSSEFHLNFANSSYEKNNKTGVKGKVLEAVALLGADLPQVANLQDLTTYLAEPTGGDRLLCSVPMAPMGDEKIRPGSPFHPIQKVGGVYVLHLGNREIGRYMSLKEAIAAMRQVEKSGMQPTPLVSTSGNESLHTLLETAERLVAKQQAIGREMDAVLDAQATRRGGTMEETNTPTLDSVLTEDERAYLSQGGYAADTILKRASERLTAATIAANKARDVRTRTERQRTIELEDQERSNRFNAALASCMREMGSHSKSDANFSKALALLAERYPELTGRRGKRPEDRLVLALRASEGGDGAPGTRASEGTFE